MEKVKRYFKELSNNMERNHASFIKLIDNANYSIEERSEILKAYYRAMQLHGGQVRKSGEPFILHPLNIACVLIDKGFNYETICAALLHDTVEDTNYTLEDIKSEFGDTIAMLVDGVTKMKGTNFSNREQEKQATHEKIIESITKDARIIAIKLVDRLHNMLTLTALTDAKQREIASETKEFYVPLARFLGIYQLKDELQDLCLFYLNQEAFLEYYERRNVIKAQNVPAYKYVSGETSKSLLEKGVMMRPYYKVKNVGGIYAELENGKKIKEIDDLVAIRMVVGEQMECYQALGVIHNILDCEHVLGTLNDYISTPKYNGYSSLNTVIRWKYSDYNLQARIRTEEMNLRNSLGAVSSWTPQSQKVIADGCRKLIAGNGSEKSTKEFNRASKVLLMKGK